MFTWKWCPAWTQLTSGQVVRKLTTKSPTKIVAKLATINFWSWWPKVGRKRSIEKGDQLGHLFYFRTSCPEVEALLLHPNLGWSRPISTCGQLGHKSPDPPLSKSFAKLARFFNFVPTWDEVDGYNLIPSWDEFPRSLPLNLSGSYCVKVGPAWPNYCPCPSL